VALSGGELGATQTRRTGVLYTIPSGGVHPPTMRLALPLATLAPEHTAARTRTDGYEQLMRSGVAWLMDSRAGRRVGDLQTLSDNANVRLPL